jgi:hypothetical protein
MRLRLCGLALASLIGLAACGGSGDSSEEPPRGTLELTVVDAETAAGLSNVRVTVIDGGTGESIDVLSTDGSGKVSKVYETGGLQLRVSTQNYSASPPPGIPPLPAQIVQDQTTSITVRLSALPAGERGMISGQITDSQGQPADGALIVASIGEDALLSTIAGPGGSYVLHNVPVGSVTLNAFLGGHNFGATGPVSVTAGANVDQNITAVGAASGEISGHVSFTSVSGSIIDITLLHPGTRDALPRLRTLTDGGGSYLMTGVPNGEFEIIASLENDGYVLDPDESVTQGIPVVVITELAPVIANEDFKVTGSIQLTSPPSTTDAVIPEMNDTPTFTWDKASSYASAEYYVVEVVDESAATIWGGFDSASNFAPLVTVPQGNDPSAGYNFDGTATLVPLEAGRHYQLRVYAAVADTSVAKGYRLLSASETLDGIFKVPVAQ